VEAVLVLNADLGPLHRVSIRHAVRMLFREVAVVHESEPDRQLGIFPMPRIVRLINYVVPKWRYSSGPGLVPAGRPQPRRTPVRVLLAAGDDRRACDPQLARGQEHLAQHGRVLRTVQPAQGQPDARRGGHAATGQPGRAVLGVDRRALTGRRLYGVAGLFSGTLLAGYLDSESRPRRFDSCPESNWQGAQACRHRVHPLPPASPRG
jgi:hypothetical protein